MPRVVNARLKSWLKAITNLKLSSDAAVTRLTYEGITNFRSLVDFNKQNIDALPAIYKNSIPTIVENIPNGVEAEVEIPGG